MLGCCTNNEKESYECKDCATSEKEMKRQKRPQEQKILKPQRDWRGQDLNRFTRKSPKPRSAFAARSGSLPEPESAPAVIFEPKRQFVEQQLSRFSSRIQKDVRQVKAKSETVESAPVANQPSVMSPTPVLKIDPEVIKPKQAGGGTLAVLGLLILGGILLSSGSNSK